MFTRGTHATGVLSGSALQEECVPKTCYALAACISRWRTSVRIRARDLFSWRIFLIASTSPSANLKFKRNSDSFKRSTSACRSSSAISRYLSDRKSTRLNSSHLVISYAVFCLKKKKNQPQRYLGVRVLGSRPLRLTQAPVSRHRNP